MTKLDIITGFLGAGKTTFINRYAAHCEEAGEKTVVLVNDYSEDMIDNSLLTASCVRNLSDGCVCCTLKLEFIKEIKNILKEISPDRIIFEPSGVFMLTENLNQLNKMKNLTVNSVTCIVDGANYYLQRADFAPFIDNQLEHATKIIISKTEISNISDSVIADIKSSFPEVPVAAKPYNEFDAADYRLQGLPVKNINFRDAHPSPLCFSKSITRKFSSFMLKQIVKNFRANRYGNIIRGKGIFEKEAGGYCVINVIANNAEITDIDAEKEKPRIAVMGEYLAGALLRADFF